MKIAEIAKKVRQLATALNRAPIARPGPEVCEAEPSRIEVESVENVDCERSTDVHDAPRPGAGAPSMHSTISTEYSQSSPDAAADKSYAETRLPPFSVRFGTQEFEAKFWNGAIGAIAPVFAYDTETKITEDPGTVPEFVIASVCDGSRVHFVRRADSSLFWRTHKDCTVFMHSAAFDIPVTEQAADFTFTNMIRRDLIVDVAILWRLLVIATAGTAPQRFSLATIAESLLGVTLSKDEDVRTGFGRYLVEGRPQYQLMSRTDLEYAARDAISTFMIGDRLTADVRRLCATIPGASRRLSHDLQIRTSLALRTMERRGIGVDRVRLESIQTMLEQEQNVATDVLRRYGYVPGTPGVNGVYEQVIGSIERERGIRIRRTSKSGKIGQKAEDLQPLADHEFVAAFMHMKDSQKAQTTFVDKLKAAGARVHPHYDLLTVTGRTSCRSPNLQQLPREGGIRECIAPAAGHVFIAADYSAVELCTLAQVLYNKYKTSHMCALINRGVDLHRFVAATVLNKPQDQVSKDERQKAKALDFGLPAGMGTPMLTQYAKQNYGVALTQAEAEHWKDTWFRLFPEVKRYLREDGHTVVIQPFGRVRAKCRYTTFHNTPFQGMAADGAKLALCELTDAGFPVAIFVHDEFVVEVPEAPDLTQLAKDIERIMINAMAVVCPDVQISVEYAAMRRWSKSAEATYDKTGRLIPWEDSITQRPEYGNTTHDEEEAE
ncbi:MAG: hypothetical protein JXR37_00560 [Kiritimatiellae bacterium]|nr:hypothetical protein [Kiritimatiellia bacterium]